MARRGRKRKQTLRQPNGQPSRANGPAMDIVVLAQPTRRGNRDQKCATVFGRFCLRNKLRQELFDAGETYAGVVLRWRAAKGIPTPFRRETARGGAGASKEVIEKWAEQMVGMEIAMVANGHLDLLAVKQLVLDEADLGMDQEQHGIDGLENLAVHLGLILPNSPIKEFSKKEKKAA